MTRVSALIFLLLLLASPRARAYPEFIGFGYTSCATCHYNTQGSGPLNDYGRALFAGELSSRALIDEETTDDELGTAAGFLGKKELPWWLRPSFKYRGLWYQTDPGSVATQKKFVVMQEDFDMTILLNREAKLLVTGNVGLVRVNGRGGFSNDAWVSREHYIRWMPTKELFISVGMLDKVFGIRLVDHTAFSRSKLGINQWDNPVGTLTHGAVIQWAQPEREYTLHAFIGNLNETEDIAQKGASFMAEYSTGEKSRTGASLLYSSNKTLKKSAVAVHEKLGIGTGGSSILAELGLHRDDNSALSSVTTGYYLYGQSTVLLTRGYNFLGLAELYKAEVKSATDTEQPDQFRWGLGLLTFPLPRTEFRITAQDYRTWYATKNVKDSWTLLLQLHLSI